MNREYAIYFEGKNGFEELGAGSNFFKACSQARTLHAEGAKNITLKHYENNDLIHQWDLVKGKWKKYE